MFKRMYERSLVSSFTFLIITFRQKMSFNLEFRNWNEIHSTYCLTLPFYLLILYVAATKCCNQSSIYVYVCCVCCVGVRTYLLIDYHRCLSGLTITACPLAPDSKAYEYVEIFSAGWNERPNFAIANRSKAISVEFLRPENGDFSFNWMELIPGPTLSIAGKLFS